MRLRISHHTRYHYDQSPVYALQRLRKTPKTSSAQDVLEWKMTLDGCNEELAYDDHFGNRVVLVSFDAGESEFSVLCEGEVDVKDTAGVFGKNRGPAPIWYFRRSTELTAAGAGIRSIVRDLPAGSDTIAKLHELSVSVVHKVAYNPGNTDATTTAEEALQVGHGVCQDHAHIFISAARLSGLPARYVSGYLLTESDEDHDASHAWAEVHVDGVGWIGFDPANGISPDHRYVRVATGLDYRDAAPSSGLRFGLGAERMHVQVQVEQ